MLRRVFSVVLTFSVVMISSLSAQAALVDYNTPGDLTNYFNLNVNPPVTNKYFQVANGGISNSGAVDLLNTTDSDHTTAVYNPAEYGFTSLGDSITITQYIRRQNANNTSTPFAQMGLLSDVTERMDAGLGNTNSYASVRLMPSLTTTSTDVFAQIETKVNGGSRVRTTFPTEFSLIASRWYLLSTTFTYTSATDISVSGSLEDWGPTGTTYSSTAFSFAPTVVALSGLDQINGDSSVFAGYRVFHEGGTDLVDNFAVVPEPASLALLVAGLSMLRRRR